MRLNRLFVTFLLTLGIVFSCQPGIGSTIQTFEDGTLDGWTIGGRRLGSNAWGVTNHAGSQMAYISHSSFSELTIIKKFDYSTDMNLSFDAEFFLNGSSTPSPSGGSSWNSANALIGLTFFDDTQNSLGFKGYVAETTHWFTNQTTQNYSLFYPNGLQHYDFDISTIAASEGIDTSLISQISLFFSGYSPVHNSGNRIQIYFDNVETSGNVSNPIPEPSTSVLFGFGLLLVGLINRKRTKKFKL